MPTETNLGISSEVVSLSSDPEETVASLASAGDIDVLVLDTENSSGQEVQGRAVQWIQTFQQEWLRRSAQAQLGLPDPSTVPPAVVVLVAPVEPGNLFSEMDRQLAAVGAIVYERSDPEVSDLGGLLADIIASLPVEIYEELEATGPEDEVRGAAARDLSAYSDPV